METRNKKRKYIKGKKEIERGSGEGDKKKVKQVYKSRKEKKREEVKEAYQSGKED